MDPDDHRTKVTLFDTHVHFDPAWPAAERQALLERAWTAGVERLIAVGGAPAENRLAVELARAQPDRIRAAVGCNRDLAGAAWDVEELAPLLALPEVVAVGEVGLDFHRTTSDRAAQTRLFARMLELAREHRRPVIVHSREAEAETLALLERHAGKWAGAPGRIGVQHCFTGSPEFAARLLALGFSIGFSGILTFKNAKDLRAIAAGIPADRLLIETDSPWLAPEPVRGKPNEPANVRRVAETLAEIRKTSVGEIAAITFRNAERIFGRSE
jgi:TatD DNase family protein